MLRRVALIFLSKKRLLAHLEASTEDNVDRFVDMALAAL
jgi:hypothetical protein